MVFAGGCRDTAVGAEENTEDANRTFATSSAASATERGSNHDAYTVALHARTDRHANPTHTTTNTSGFSDHFVRKLENWGEIIKKKEFKTTFFSAKY